MGASRRARETLLPVDCLRAGRRLVGESAAGDSGCELVAAITALFMARIFSATIESGTPAKIIETAAARIAQRPAILITRSGSRSAQPEMQRAVVGSPESLIRRAASVNVRSCFCDISLLVLSIERAARVSMHKLRVVGFVASSYPPDV